MYKRQIYNCAVKKINCVFHTNVELKRDKHQYVPDYWFDKRKYDKVEENIRWFIENAGSGELKAMGTRGRENLEKNLTRAVSVSYTHLDVYKRQQLYNRCSGNVRSDDDADWKMDQTRCIYRRGI